MADQSIDEPNTKNSKIESVVSTTSKSKLEDHFLSLPPDVLSKIIANTSIQQWPSLEFLDTNFRAATLIPWRQLRNSDVDRDFMINFKKWTNRSSFGKSVSAVLRKLLELSPFLTSLSGIDIQSDSIEFYSDIVHALAQFEHLQSITIGNVTLIGGHREIRLIDIVVFLESTCSRTSLKELNLYNVAQWPYSNSIIDRLCSSFDKGRGIRSPLKLEKFTFTSLDPLYIRLDTLDATRLTALCLRKAYVEPQQLTSLIERASKLDRIELSFLGCYRDCNGPRLEANKKILMALACHETLRAMILDRLGSIYDARCTAFRGEFIEMLKLVGGRGRLRKLALEDAFERSSTVIVRELISRTIFNLIPSLHSIKLNIDFIRSQHLRDLVSLTELEDIYLTSTGQDLVTEEVIRKIAQLPRLKRLGLTNIGRVRNSFDDLTSLESLANASTLTDLRIGFGQWINADVFEKWSNGFASNLEILMLGRIAEKDKREENGLVRLLEKAVRLRVLILEGRVTDQSLMAIAKSCAKLETLGVRSSSNEITVQGSQEIVNCCSKLKRFGGFGYEIRDKLKFPKYRKIGEVDMAFWMYDFDDGQYD